MFIDSVREDKLERRRSLGKAPAMTSACHLRDSLPGAPSQNGGGNSLHDRTPLDRASAESFQRNSQGAHARACMRTCVHACMHERAPAAQRAVCHFELLSYDGPAHRHETLMHLSAVCIPETAAAQDVPAVVSYESLFLARRWVSQRAAGARVVMWEKQSRSIAGSVCCVEGASVPE